MTGISGVLLQSLQVRIGVVRIIGERGQRARLCQIKVFFGERGAQRDVGDPLQVLDRLRDRLGLLYTNVFKLEVMTNRLHTAGARRVGRRDSNRRFRQHE